jgi:uncharacterized glyoxalase superfamily protein PhnB
MTDPFDALATPVEPQAPRPAFARALRARVVDELGLDPMDALPTVDLPQRSTMSTTAPARRATAAVAATVLVPYLSITGATRALDWYAEAFGAVEVLRVVGDDGRIGHAEITIGAARVMLADEYPEYDVRSPQTLGGSPVLLHLTVPDVDAAFGRAVAAGATSLGDPEDQPHGNRHGTLVDPFGHRWMLSQSIEVLDLQRYAARETGGFRVEPGPGSTGTGADAASSVTPPTVWACVNCLDARATIAILVDTFGFEARMVVADDADPSIVHHAELRWPEGGGIMLGTADRQGNEYSRMPTGAASCYIVSSQVDRLWERALDAGLDVVRELRDEDYGSRGFSVRDPEGNIWSFGTYAGG